MQCTLFHPDASGPGKELRGVPPAQLQPQLIYPAAAGGGGGDEASDDPPVFADGYQGNDVISAALEADVTLAAAGNHIAHHAFIYSKPAGNPIPGHSVGVALADGIPDPIPGFFRGPDAGKTVAIGSGESGMMVGGAHKGEPVAPAQPFCHSVVGIQGAHVVVVVKGAVGPHGAAMLGIDLHNGRSCGIEIIPADAPVPGGVADVVGHHNAAAAAVPYQLPGRVPLNQGQVGIRGDNVIVAVVHRVHFIGLEGDQLFGICHVDGGQDLRPVLPQLGKACLVVLYKKCGFLVAGNHVRPHGMAGHTAEIQVLCSLL